MSDPQFEWDGAKAARNLALHGIAFEAIQGFDWEDCMTREDTRGDYGERRSFRSVEIGPRLHVAVWTARREGRRLISLRKANPRERAIYGRR